MIKKKNPSDRHFEDALVHTDLKSASILSMSEKCLNLQLIKQVMEKCLNFIMCLEVKVFIERDDFVVFTKA